MDTTVKKIEDHTALLKKTLDEAMKKVSDMDKERSNLIIEIARMNGAIVGYEDCARLLKEAPPVEEPVVVEGEIVT